MYRLLSEVSNTELFSGSLKECEKVIEAFVKYGIPERKLVIEYPEHHGFKISEKLRDVIVEELIDHRQSGIDYSGFTYEYAQDEIEALNDFGLLEELHFYREVFDEEESISKLYKKASFEYKNFLADKVILNE
jgi:hypothetical protein